MTKNTDLYRYRAHDAGGEMGACFHEDQGSWLEVLGHQLSSLVWLSSSAGMVSPPSSL